MYQINTIIIGIFDDGFKIILDFVKIADKENPERIFFFNSLRTNKLSIDPLEFSSFQNLAKKKFQLFN